MKLKTYTIKSGPGLILLLALVACGDSSPTVSNLVTSGTGPVSSVNTTRVAAPATTTGSTGFVLSTPNSGAVSGSPTPGQSGLSSVPAEVTTASGQVIKMRVELARSEQEQETGLMGRTSLPDDSGMLFIFPGKVRTGFWMKDTLLPLSIAWIDEKGNIWEIHDMEAKSEEVHTPAQAYIWALEVPKGYFSKKGVKAGSTLKLLTP